MALGPQILRLPLERDARLGVLDLISGEEPYAWRSTHISLELGFFNGDGVEDISAAASITMLLKPDDDRDGTSLLEKTTAVFDLTLDSITWADGTKQHITIDLTSDEMNISLSNLERRRFWLVCYATTASGEIVPLGGVTVTIRESGIPGGGATAEVTWQDTADARYQRNLPAITALTGGGASALDSIETVAESGVRIAVAHAGSGADLEYLLESGTDAENVPWVIRPDDYAAATNEKVWKLRRISKDGAQCRWEATNEKFHQVEAEIDGSGNVTAAIDQTGFQILS